MTDDNLDNESGMQKNDAGEKSPDEIKENVKQSVAKGVAAVAGALKGFTEEAKKHDLAGSTKEAIQKAGETTREVAGTAKKELRQTKERLTKGEVGSSSFGSSSLGGSSDVPDLRKTD